MDLISFGKLCSKCCITFGALRQAWNLKNKSSNYMKSKIEKQKPNKQRKPRLRKARVSGSLPIANPHHCPECSWQCTCSSHPCSCCQGNDR